MFEIGQVVRIKSYKQICQEFVNGENLMNRHTPNGLFFPSPMVDKCGEYGKIISINTMGYIRYQIKFDDRETWWWEEGMLVPPIPEFIPFTELCFKHRNIVGKEVKLNV